MSGNMLVGSPIHTCFISTTLFMVFGVIGSVLPLTP